MYLWYCSTLLYLHQASSAQRPYFVLCSLQQVVEACHIGLHASVTPDRLASAFAEVHNSTSSSRSSWAAAVLWDLYDASKADAGELALTDAAGQAAKLAALGAYREAGGRVNEEVESYAEMAAGQVGNLALKITHAFLEEHHAALHHSDDLQGIFHSVLIEKTPAAASNMFRKWASDSQEQLGDTGVQAVAVAAGAAAARVCKSPWLGLSRQSWCRVVCSLQLDLVMAKGEHKELLGGWTGDPGKTEAAMGGVQ